MACNVCGDGMLGFGYTCTGCGRVGESADIYDRHRTICMDRDRITAERDQLLAECERLRQAEERLRHHPMAPDRCTQCDWINVNLMNYGDTERSIWLCHGCAADVIRTALAVKGKGE